MYKRIIIVCIIAIIAAATIGIVMIFGKDDGNPDTEKQNEDAGKTVGLADGVRVELPEGITKIKIVDGDNGNTIVLDDKELEQFGEKLRAVCGEEKLYDGSHEGYGYAVQCYREEERVFSFCFMTGNVISENVGSVGREQVREITFDVTNPAYTYIEDLFAKNRSQ